MPGGTIVAEDLRLVSLSTAQKRRNLRNNAEPDLLVSRQDRTHIDVLSGRFGRLPTATLQISL